MVSSSKQCAIRCVIQGCATCSSNSTCSLCNTGLTISSDQKFCVVNCLIGYYLNSATKVCAQCTPPKCLTCDSTGRCNKCQDLYFLNNTSCQACNTISNCFYCNPVTGACIICNSGFSLVGSVCTSQLSCKAANCDACVTDSTTDCQRCSDGYKLNGTTCAAIICPGSQLLSGSTCTCAPKSYMY
jgi:hypothetical protein